MRSILFYSRLYIPTPATTFGIAFRYLKQTCVWNFTDQAQDCIEEADGRFSFDALVITSWLVKDETEDAIPATNSERIKMMKRRAEGFAEPLKSIVMDIPDDLDFTTPLRLGDFPCLPWDNKNGRVTLAGDSCHAMTM